MKQKYLLLLAVFGITILFSGCAAKTRSCEINKGPQEYPNGKVFFLTGEESWRSPSAGYNVRTRNAHVLQNAAQLTIDNGFKYFAFIKPSGEISNKEGSLINTAEDFIKHCAPVSLNPFVIGNSNCGWDSETPDAYAIIVMYKKQPLEMTTYDAKSVKEYMIAQKLWREDGLEKKYSICTDDIIHNRI